MKATTTSSIRRRLPGSDARVSRRHLAAPDFIGPRRVSVSNLADVITHRHIVDFATDGVVCLRQVINPDWIETLTAGLAQRRRSVASRSVWNTDEHGRVTFYDSQVWQEIPEYRDFIENSPMAKLAGRVMNVEA